MTQNRTVIHDVANTGKVVELYDTLLSPGVKVLEYEGVRWFINFQYAEYKAGSFMYGEPGLWHHFDGSTKF